jgi:hypothetical protein
MKDNWRQKRGSRRIWFCLGDWIQSDIKEFENFYWNQQREGKTSYGVMKIITSFMTETFPYLTEDIVKEWPVRNVSIPFRISSLQESKLPRNSLSSCCSSLFVTVSVCRQPDARFGQSKSISENQKPDGSVYRLRL